MRFIPVNRTIGRVGDYVRVNNVTLLAERYREKWSVDYAGGMVTPIIYVESGGYTIKMGNGTLQSIRSGDVTIGYWGED